jgi:hypothetical protein
MRFAYELPIWWNRAFPQLSQALQSPDFDPLLLARWTVQSFLFSLLIFAADYLFGAGLLLTLTRRYRLSLSAPLRIAVSLALGNGLGGLLLFLLGCARLLTPLIATAAVVACGIAGFELLRRQDGFAWATRSFAALKPSGLSLALLLLFLPVLLLHQLDLQMPVLEGDSMLYHLSSARWYADHHRLAYHPGIRFNAQPQQTVLVYLRQWLITGEETNLKLVNWEYLLILLTTLLGGLRLLGARRFAPAAVIFTLASPVFCFITKIELADLGLTAYLTLGVVLLVGTEPLCPRIPSCALAGLMLGFAAASKLQGMVTVAGFCAAWLLVAYSKRTSNLLHAATAIAIGIIIPGLGWWMRSLYYTGSPAYPFFTSDSDSKALFAASVRYGFGHDWAALLALPWRMITESSFRFADPYIFGVPFLILIVAGAAALIRTRARVSPAVLILTGGTLVYFTFWFLTGQVMRYLVSLLPVMALLFGAALQSLRFPRARWAVVLPLLPVALVAAATPSRVLLHGLPPPVSHREREVILTAALPHYRAVRALNRIAHPGERVYLWFCEDVRFHLRATSYGDWFGLYNFNWLGRKAETTQKMLDRLRGAGFKYIVVDRDRANVGGTIYDNDFLQTAFVQDEGPSGDAQLVIREGRYRVFKLD